MERGSVVDAQIEFDGYRGIGIALIELEKWVKERWNDNGTISCSLDSKLINELIAYGNGTPSSNRNAQLYKKGKAI